MNPRFTLFATIILSPFAAQAQSVTEEPAPRPAFEAVQAFGPSQDSKPNEVSVVLDPPIAEAVVEQAPAVEEKPASPASVLVTGTPPPEATIGDAVTPPPAEATATPAAEEPPKPQPGLAVHVETLHTGSGTLDGKSVKLSAPFPAKPLSQPPAGWRLETPENTPAFTRTVTLAPNSEITLTIRPHLLVPAADGTNVFSITEPGYDSTLGYLQTGTVSAVLSNSVQELDENSKQLGNAIENLQQLLVSLPKSEEPERRATPRASTIRNR